jgi:fatty-acyl-CoA synthase
VPGPSHSTAELDALLSAAAGDGPERPALAGGDLRLTYGELDAAVERVRHRLDRLAAADDGGAGLAGARVAVIAPNVPALVIGMFAAWRAGAVAVPLSARLREYELSRALEDAEAEAAVAVATHRGYSFADVLGALLAGLPALRGCLFVGEAGAVEREIVRDGRVQRPQRLSPRIAGILYTSGSTGVPKGALVEHSSLLRTAHAMADLLALTSADRTALPIPASHAFGLGCLLAGVARRGETVLLDSGISPGPLLDAVAGHGATVVHGSPPVFAGLVKAGPAALAGVRGGFVAGTSTPPGLLEALDAAHVRILNMFGMTELGAAACCRAEDPPAARYGTVGRPLPGYTFRTAGAGVDDPSVGELQVRGPHVTPGYHGRPELTAEAFDGGWFRTGDVGRIDAHGRIRVVGRLKDVVHVGGFSVFPAEVETFLLTHPAVAQAAVVGAPHPTLGEALKAFVVAREGGRLDPPALLRFARARIAGYKVPYGIEVVSEIPVLPSGKPDRAALRRRVEGSPLAPGRR